MNERININAEERIVIGGIDSRGATMDRDTRHAMVGNGRRRKDITVGGFRGVVVSGNERGGCEVWRR